MKKHNHENETVSQLLMSSQAVSKNVIQSHNLWESLTLPRATFYSSWNVYWKQWTSCMSPKYAMNNEHGMSLCTAPMVIHCLQWMTMSIVSDAQQFKPATYNIFKFYQFAQLMSIVHNKHPIRYPLCSIRFIARGFSLLKMRKWLSIGYNKLHYKYICF